MPFDGVNELPKVTQLLMLGKERIEKYGWHTGGCKGLDGSMCIGMSIWAFGSYRNADGTTDWCPKELGSSLNSAKWYLEETIYKHCSQYMAGWNDHMAESKEEVIAMLDRAILLSLTMEKVNA